MIYNVSTNPLARGMLVKEHRLVWRRSLLLSSCVALTCLGGSEAAAQNARPGPAPSGAANSDPTSAPAAQQGATVIGEVIVTANKRAENLQKVAESVTAVTQANLTRQGVKEITDISRVVPEVQVLVGPYTNITIRGVRTGTYGPSTDSPNAVHIDGAYVSRFTSLNGLFFDVQRVEVLDGPQGTLYGRNSAGGALNVITNKPTSSFGGYGSLEYGDYNAVTANLAVNVPVTDKLSVRGAYYHNSHDGYADNGTDDALQDSGRLSLLWKPTPQDALLITTDREVVGGRGFASNHVDLIVKQPSILTTGTGALQVVPAGAPGGVIVPITTSSDPRDNSAFYGLQDLNRVAVNSDGVMGQYDHDFGWADLTFQTSYRDTSTRNALGTNLGFTEDPRLVTTGVARPPTPAAVEANARWDSEELRLTSPSHQDLTYVVGLFRFHENAFGNHNDTILATYPNTRATIGQRLISNPLVLATDIANPINLDDAYAAFGQATYTPPILPALHLTGGLRYNDEKKSASGYEVLNATLAPATVFKSAATFKATTYKANVAYDLTSRNLIYFDTSTGFKAGGFAYGFNPEYQPENITAYEIGTKNRFFENRLQVNASAWHYDYRNLTATVNQFYLDTTLGRTNAVINTTNAPRTTIDGQSMAIEALLTRNDIFELNVTHLRAVYTSFNLIANYAYALAHNTAGPGATAADFDYTGTPVGNDPDWVFDTTYDHVFKIAGGEVDAQVAVHYVGERLFPNVAAIANANNYLVGAPYATGDVSLRFEPASRRWSLTGYVRNLIDENVIIGRTYISNAIFLPPTDPRVTFAYRTEQLGPPRTFGLIFAANF